MWSEQLYPEGTFGGGDACETSAGVPCESHRGGVYNPVRSSPPLRRTGVLGGTTPARSQHGCRAALISGGAHTRVGLPPQLPPGATRGSRDSRAVCPLPRQRATGLQRNQQCSNFTEVEPVQAEVPLEDNAPNRESGRVGARGGLRHPDSGTTLGRATNGAAAPLGPSTAAGTATDEWRPAATSILAEGFISTRTRARTRMAARAGTRSSDAGEGRQNPTETLHGVSPQHPTMTRLTSSTTPVEPIPSPPESCPGTPRLRQQARETMQSPAATGPGSPLTLSLIHI